MPLANHVDNVCALEGVFAEQDAIKRVVELLHRLVNTTSARD
jgi:hypothetical protein